MATRISNRKNLRFKKIVKIGTDETEKAPTIVWMPHAQVTEREPSVRISCVAQGNPVPDVT